MLGEVCIFHPPHSQLNSLSAMKFTFIHYTEGWHTGPTVELSTIPPLGTLVKAGDDSVESFFDIYYVDNVLLADGCTNYLFVRPFEGYGVRAPLTEADRITEAIKDLTEAVDNFDDNMHIRTMLIRD